MSLITEKKHNNIKHNSVSRFYILSAAAVMFFFLFADINFVSAKNFTILNALNVNQPYFSVNGATGNVGIGTTAPTSPLHIKRDVTDGVGILRVEGTEPDINFNDTDGGYNTFTFENAGSAMWAFGRNSANDFYFTRNNGGWFDDTLLIQRTTGNLGIGTTNPGATLDIGGAIASFRAKSATLSNIGSGLIMADGSGNLYSTSSAVATGIPSPSGISGYTLRSNGTNWIANNLLFNDGTNVGIGTTNPGYKLDVNGDLRVTGGSYFDGGTFVKDQSGTADSWWGWYAWEKEFQFNKRNSANGFVQNIFTANWDTGDFVIVPNSGNVGIGTTNPGAKLDVNGSILAGSPTYNDVVTNKMILGGSFTLQNMAATDGLFGMQFKASNYYGAPSVSMGVNVVSGAAESFRFVGSSAVPIMTIQNNFGGPTGNVGIGTTNPGTTLDVGGATGSFRAKSGTLSNIGSGIIMADGSGNLYSTSSLAAISAGWTVNGTTVYKTDINGNVGIGTTAPGTKLEVSGTNVNSDLTAIRITNTSGRTYALTSGIKYVDENGFSIRDITGGTTPLVINTNGNVGIGTTNPLSPLDIATSNVYGVSSTLGINLSNTSSGSNVTLPTGLGAISWKAGSYTTAKIEGVRVNPSGGAQTDIVFSTGNTSGASEKMRIQENGNVGIGATNSLSKLDVLTTLVPSVDTYSGLNLRADNYGYLIQGGIKQGLGGTLIFSSNQAGVYTERIRFDNNGNVGIGTTAPGTTLDVGGATGSFRAKSGTLSNIGSGIIMADGSGNLYSTSSLAAISAGWTVNGTTVYKTDINGNVGIGTTAPGAKLDISGAGSSPDLLKIAGTTFTSVLGGGDLIVRNLSQLRFEDGNNWDYNKWAGIKFDSTNNRLTIGGPASSAFTSNANPPQINIILDGGNVGIGTTNPGTALQVSGTISAINLSNTLGASTPIIWGSIGSAYSTWGVSVDHVVESADNNIYGMALFTTNSYLIGRTEKVRITGDGNVGIGTTNPGTTLDVGGATGSFRAKSATLSNIGSGIIMADSSGNLFSTTSPSFAGGTMTGDLNMNGFNILNVNKLTVNTIDPLYSIKGIKYSTYASSMSGGVKEEYVGKITVNTLGANKEYEKIIDFSNEPEGTDLWVWRQVIDYNSENVEVLITPYGRFANAYYLIKNNQLIFRSDKPVTLSYRLIGRRFDWNQWPTKAFDQTQTGGLEIK